nr:hypothetical protein [Bacteroidales bacterium]
MKCLFYRLIGVFFIFAAIGKASNSSPIENVLYFFNFPSIVIQGVIWMLIISEIVIGLAMLFQVFPLVTAIVAFISLVFFTIMLIILLIQPEVPHCGCTGNIVLFKTAFAENLFGVIRNIFFLLIIAFYWTGITKS